MDQVQILLLRGVNVGGRNLLPMDGFRRLLSGLGLASVKTHIQSGNAVFRGPDPQTLAPRIAQAMQAEFGFAPETFLYSQPDFAAILAANPFADAGALDGAKVHIFFLASPAPSTNLEAIQTLAGANERFLLTDTAFYLHAPDGMGRSVLVEKLARHLKSPMTARNQRSAGAIAALARDLMI